MMIRIDVNLLIISYLSLFNAYVGTQEGWQATQGRSPKLILRTNQTETNLVTIWKKQARFEKRWWLSTEKVEDPLKSL
jgi:hypothetical protein